MERKEQRNPHSSLGIGEKEREAGSKKVDGI